MLRKICQQYTSLTNEDIQQLEEMEKQISYFSAISNADIFIDCFLDNEEKGIVVAHAMPETGSQYRGNITGQFVLHENEPIVFLTKKMDVSIRDEKAITQENQYVLQRTVPIKNPCGQIIGILIQENNITNSVNTNRKLEEMEKETERLADRLQHAEQERGALKQRGSSSPMEEENQIMLKEMHHRIKNNLQLISSILSMQERRSQCKETKSVLKDDIGRINSIAWVHEALLNEGGREIPLNTLAEKLVLYLRDWTESMGKHIEIRLEGDHIVVDSEKAASIMLILNELVTNALRHGFPFPRQGTVIIQFIYGRVYSTIVVTDNGIGFEKAKISPNSLGLTLMKKIAGDKLDSSLEIRSGEYGTTASFDFK